MVDCSTTLDGLWIAGQFFDAVVCPFSDPMGGVFVFGLFVYGAIGGALYIYSGSAVLPLVLTLILGSVVVTQLPGPAVQIVGVFALLLIAGALYYLITTRGPARA